MRSIRASPVFAIGRYTVVEALRNRLLWLVAVVVLIAFALAGFMAQVALTEVVALQSGVLGAMLRVSAVFLVSLFVVTSIVREFQDKVFELVLSLPIARAVYFLGKLLGFCAVAVVVAAVYGLCLLVYVPPLQAGLWAISLGCELVIVTALSLLCLFTFNQVTVALSAVFAFYVLSRTIGALQLMAHGPLAAGHSLEQRVIEGFVGAVAFLLPELDRFTSSEWLVYHSGSWVDLLPILGQTGVYLLLLCAAALFDLYRKNL